MAKDYRALKKFVNKYHNFSFKIPRKGKDFSPQQKAAITRVFNKIKEFDKSITKNTAGFLKLKKTEIKNLPENFDYLIKTNKGIFTKFSEPKKTKTKEGLIVTSRVGVRTEKFFPFPKGLNTMEKIQIYVNKLIKKYKPNYVRWSVRGYKGGELFSTETFNMYATEFGDSLKNSDAEKRFSEDTFFNGVFLGWLNTAQ